MPTGYNLPDRFREPSSYIGLLIGLLMNALPVIPPDVWLHIVQPAADILASLLFFMPDNRIVIAAAQDFARIEAAAPQGYARPGPIFPQQQPAAPQAAAAPPAA